MKKAIAVSCTIFSLCLLMTSCGSSSTSEKADENGHYGTSTDTSVVTTTDKNSNDKSDTSDTKMNETDKKDETNENGGTDKKGMGEDIGEDIGEAVDTAIHGAETLVSDIVSDIS